MFNRIPHSLSLPPPRRVIKLTSPTLNMMIAVGIILTNLATPLSMYPPALEEALPAFCHVSSLSPSLPPSLPPSPLLSLSPPSPPPSLTVYMLQVRSWVLPIGWSLSLCTITVKMWRVFVIYRTTRRLQSLKQKKVCIIWPHMFETMIDRCLIQCSYCCSNAPYM